MPIPLNQLQRGKFYRVVSPRVWKGQVVLGMDPFTSHESDSHERSYCVFLTQPDGGDDIGTHVSNDSWAFEEINVQFDGFVEPEAVTDHDLEAAHRGGRRVYYRANPGWYGARSWTDVTQTGHEIREFNTTWYSFTFDPETP